MCVQAPHNYQRLTPLAAVNDLCELGPESVPNVLLSSIVGGMHCKSCKRSLGSVYHERDKTTITDCEVNDCRCEIRGSDKCAPYERLFGLALLIQLFSSTMLKKCSHPQ